MPKVTVTRDDGHGTVSWSQVTDTPYTPPSSSRSRFQSRCRNTSVRASSLPRSRCVESATPKNTSVVAARGSRPWRITRVTIPAGGRTPLSRHVLRLPLALSPATDVPLDQRLDRIDVERPDDHEAEVRRIREPATNECQGLGRIELRQIGVVQEWHARGVA